MVQCCQLYLFCVLKILIVLLETIPKYTKLAGLTLTITLLHQAFCQTSIICLLRFDASVAKFDSFVRKNGSNLTQKW